MTDPASSSSIAVRRGVMLVLSSPSGAGKTTLSRRLLERDAGIAMSVSVTTRQPRSGEVDGRDYHFRTREDFAALRDAGGLLEWAEVHGNLYGTPAADVMERLDQGTDVLFDIDWQGAAQLAEKAPADTVRIFILPPSASALEARLIGRQQDGADVIERRLRGAVVEIEQWAHYDYVIVNRDIAESLARLEAILAAERARTRRQVGLVPEVAQMLAELRARQARPG